MSGEQKTIVWVIGIVCVCLTSLVVITYALGCNKHLRAMEQGYEEVMETDETSSRAIWKKTPTLLDK